MHSARSLTLIDIHMKFLEDSLKSFQVQTDRQTDTHGKNNMSPNPKAGRHKYFKMPSAVVVIGM